MQIRKSCYLCLFLLLIPLAGCAKTPLPAPTASPTAAVSIAPITLEPTDTPVPMTPVPMPTPVPTPFSIVWLADTQAMSYHNNVEALGAMGQWIIEQRAAQNIIYVVQTGDLVDSGYKPRQWENFEVCYNAFKNVLPYITVAGNHDLGVKLQDYTAYLARPYVRAIPRANTFGDGRAVFATFYAGGTKFLLLGAGWGAEDMSVDWMNHVLETHRDYVAILLFHSYIHDDGKYIDVGERMFEQVVKPNPNVRLVLCGHLRGTGARFEDLDDTGDGVPDRRVAAMLYNYQDAGNNCGQIRLLTFDPIARSIHVLTYSPYTQRYYEDGYFKTTEFDLPDAF